MYKLRSGEPTCFACCRLLYECNPASFIMEQAGGRGTDGLKDILDIQV